MNRQKPIVPWQALEVETGKEIVNGSQISVTELVRGTRALYAVNSMHFAVTILDARKVYGRVDALIEPIDGAGSKWVAADQLTLKQE